MDLSGRRSSELSPLIWPSSERLSPLISFATPTTMRLPYELERDLVNDRCLAETIARSRSSLDLETFDLSM